MKNHFNLEQFRTLPLMGILRGVSADQLGPVLEVSLAAGLQTLEITMNTGQAPELIHWAISQAGDRLSLGAGTVLNLSQLRAARDAGASFIVSPVLVPEIAAFCLQHAIPYFPGAFTPQEIFDAWKAGASMVKVFPAKFCGPEYFREIKGPFGDISLLACGGISPGNLKNFLDCGAAAFAFGGSVYRREWLAGAEFSRIEQALRDLIDGYRKCREQAVI